MTRVFKPRVDRLYFIILIPTLIIILGATALAFFAPTALFITVPVDLFVLYFFISPLFGRVELREESVYIKYGFIMGREIPYAKIRAVEKERKPYSETMMSLKSAMEHVNIKYNSFDVTCVSVVENDELIEELSSRMA